ncbi:MAG: DUF4271 domain-containing protein [Bacteroidaceae bacterium]|nr:DUF4271 domain-containing protein [Bacteroidaceae bacterium]
MTNALAPYNMTNDNIILLLLIFNLVGISYVLLMNGANILERTKCIFYYENKSNPYNDRTHITKICNSLMDFQTIFYATIVTTAIVDEHCFNITTENAIETIGTIAATFALFLIIKRGLYGIVNNILFSRSVSEEWDSFHLFATKLLGFTLTPAALTILFLPEIPLKFVAIYSILTLLMYLYTIIRGCAKIIFAKKCIYVDIFLYLCALEFLPIAMVWKTIQQLSDFITIKF